MQNNMVIDGQKISTWFSSHMTEEELPYQAVNMTAAISMLEGCNLTEEEKTYIPSLMAGYCRLVDEAGLVGFGACEYEAIQDLFTKAKIRGMSSKSV